MTWTEFSEWRARTTTLSAMAYALTPPITLMPTAEGSARLSGALVSSNTFAMLGGRALLGRTLDERDEAAGSNVVVLSDRRVAPATSRPTPASSDARSR